MEGMELISFNIISSVGTAKSLIMESMSLSRQGEFQKAEKNISQANEFLVKGEQEHFKIITEEAKNKDVVLTVLFMHAEDQLMSTITLRDVANEMLNMNKMIYELKQLINK